MVTNKSAKYIFLVLQLKFDWITNLHKSYVVDLAALRENSFAS